MCEFFSVHVPPQRYFMEGCHNGLDIMEDCYYVEMFSLWSLMHWRGFHTCSASYLPVCPDLRFPDRRPPPSPPAPPCPGRATAGRSAVACLPNGRKPSQQHVRARCLYMGMNWPDRWLHRKRSAAPDWSSCFGASCPCRTPETDSRPSGYAEQTARTY